MQRIDTISSHLTKNSTASTSPHKQFPDDVVICAALRTPLTKSRRGPLKDTLPELLVAHVLKAVIEKTKIDPAKIDDICIGNVLQSGAGLYQTRIASLLAGIPETTSSVSINRLCSSGLEAVSVIANKIKGGVIDIGIGGGVENMSIYDMQSMIDPSMLAEPIFEHEKARNCLLSMGQTSEVTDGAAAVLMAKRSVAEKLGLPIIARFVSYAVAGVPPELMGIGPAFAIPKALEKANLTKDDIDVWEVNEAFASQATYCCKKLGLDLQKVNPKGGAIALGHPLGCTGARQIATLLPELRRTKGRFGVVSMCIGTGMGAAAVFELE